MKKKISLVVAVLVLVLGLAGCGNAKTVSYDKDTLSQYINFYEEKLL